MGPAKASIDGFTEISPKILAKLTALSADLSSSHDLDLLLNRILSEARELAQAEAGSIFLLKDGRLRFCYVQNDLLYPGSVPAQQYVGEEMPVDTSSLAGYAAATGGTLVIDDVYQITSAQPYAFNRSFDQASGYRTQSVLVVPLITSQGRCVGVLEIINAKEESKKVRPFSKQERLWVEFYSHHAALAVERTQLTQELILRMISIAELRDPLETGVHVNRVGGYAAEIYEGWAVSQGFHAAEIKKRKDLIRVAGMLHDVGKVAISDAILKKSGRLTPEEFRAMQYHTVAGAKLFDNAGSELDAVARDIAFNHHERWDGKGYPGRLEDLAAPWQGPGVPKKGEEIPIEARITCLADVYDALVSPRVYKEPWPEDRVLELIENEKGNQFDPLVVEAFFDVYELIQLVRNRFS
jgi:response regulator RpfG family c-di-GMP phosphodiesterase